MPAPFSRNDLRRGLAAAAGLVWLVAVAAGFAAWDAYDATPEPQPDYRATPGPVGPPWTLSLYAHPHCPCTRASLAELAELARAVPAGHTVEVVFVRPDGVEPGWERTTSWDTAAIIPGARVRCDTGGAEAAQVGATTLGCAVLTDATGRVAFRGGLTRARGREGESAGRRMILGIVAGERASGEAPVFGCPLLD